jgi:YHS domain-containing protein
MTVDLEQARAKGLVREHEGREYGFCGKGCFLEFGDDPDQFLAEDYVPQM